jgi:hypothetical protein
MTDNNHPITPPPELVDQWRAIPEYADISEKLFSISITTNKLRDIATQAARWGADQELEACCEWIYKLMDRGLEWSMDLRIARRPKPPSLKEQSIALIDKIQGNKEMWDIRDLDVIRQALESLPD